MTKDEMIAKFHDFHLQINIAYGKVEDMLREGRYADASRAMTTITTTQARTSTSMHAEMVRAKLIGVEE